MWKKDGQNLRYSDCFVCLFVLCPPSPPHSKGDSVHYLFKVYRCKLTLS